MSDATKDSKGIFVPRPIKLILFEKTELNTDWTFEQVRRELRNQKCTIRLSAVYPSMYVYKSCYLGFGTYVCNYDIDFFDRTPNSKIKKITKTYDRDWQADHGLKQDEVIWCA
jgi:hypothetical protein